MMDEKARENLNRLLRDHEDLVGASRMTEIALKSLKTAIDELQPGERDLADHIHGFCDVLRQTEPRIIPLLNLIDRFEKALRAHEDGGKSTEEIRQAAREILDEKLALFAEKVRKVTEHGLAYIKEGETIIVHTASIGMRNMFITAKSELGINYRMVLLDQGNEKTAQLIKDFTRAGIDLLVVPEFDVGQVLEWADKIFIGALAATPDGKLICSVGTDNIVGMCKLHRIPVILFINTLKFSYQPAEDQHIHEVDQIKCIDSIPFSFRKSSHCTVELDHIDIMITEYGETSEEFYSKYFF